MSEAKWRLSMDIFIAPCTPEEIDKVYSQLIEQAEKLQQLAIGEAMAWRNAMIEANSEGK